MTHAWHTRDTRVTHACFTSKRDTRPNIVKHGCHAIPRRLNKQMRDGEMVTDEMVFESKKLLCLFGMRPASK